MELYSDAIDYCPDTDEFRYSAAVFLGNRSACFFHMGHYEDVVEVRFIQRMFLRYCSNAVKRTGLYRCYRIRSALCKSFNAACSGLRKIGRPRISPW